MRFPTKPICRKSGMGGRRSIRRMWPSITPPDRTSFFDIAPLKYNSWDEYEKGARGLTASYKSAKFTLNDDVSIHPHGDLVWATATVKEEMTTKAGKVEMGTFRWTVIFASEDGKWRIVHEHVSAPIQ